jgi:hypothetical protein
MKLILCSVVLLAVVCIHAQDVDNTTNGVVYLWGVTYCPNCGSGRRWGPIECDNYQDAISKMHDIMHSEAEEGRTCFLFIITFEKPPATIWPSKSDNYKENFETVTVDVTINIVRDASGKIEEIEFCLAIVKGDAHYITYDGAKLNFQGTCSYYLSTFENSPGKDLPEFQIIGRNDHPMPRMKTRSVLVETTIIFGGHEIVFQRDGTVLIDGIPTNDVFTGPGFQVVPGSDNDKFLVENGISVTYNGSKMSAFISMPPAYKDLISGMLGNFNFDAADDIRDADGNPRPDGPHGHCLIGNSYQVEPVAECSFECP